MYRAFRGGSWLREPFHVRGEGKKWKVGEGGGSCSVSNALR